MKPSDYYLDRVQEAVEAHPTWDVDEILIHVFKKWTGQHAEDFMYAVKEDMRKAEEALSLLPIELPR